jgi:hypothetical protein
VIASLVQETGEGLLENSYQLNVINTTSQDQQFSISVSGLSGIAIAKPTLLSIRAADSKSLGVRVVVDPQAAGPGSHPIVSVCKPGPSLRWWWKRNPALSGVSDGFSHRPAPAG